MSDRETTRSFTVGEENLCYYCKFFSMDLQECINHLVVQHGHLQHKLRTRAFNASTGHIGLLSKDFGVIPNLELETGQYFKVDATTFSLAVKCNNENIDILQESFHNLSLDIEVEQIASPFTIKHKTSKPLKSLHTVPYVDSSRQEETSSYEKVIKNFEEMKTLLPSVIEEMKKSGHLKPWMDFHRMVSNGNFPFDNIAFQLFMDVCRFYA
ncbi:uncharacterized protein LOC132726779 [Ruditapes philippinarum]|uniref:uncharacterized protein LOC132726779 n=1 Tax=Ruditapes philippinarum TaxID=129788 RepID=UPI00295A7530|nr:uncharacterized protein LOC132726779 [Ruditapes philippinarum]